MILVLALFASLIGHAKSHDCFGRGCDRNRYSQGLPRYNLLPQFVIDLDLPPDQRFKEVTTNFKGPTLKVMQFYQSLFSVIGISGF